MVKNDEHQFESDIVYNKFYRKFEDAVGARKVRAAEAGVNWLSRLDSNQD